MSQRAHFSPRRRPSRSNAKQTVQAVLEAAHELFTNLGYEGTSTNKIAERAGISIGSLYEYFPNKDAILFALASHQIPRFYTLAAATLRQVTEDGPPPLELFIRGALHMRLTALRSDLSLHRVLYLDSPVPARLRRMISDGEDLIVDSLRECFARMPEVKAPNLFIAARIFCVSIRVHTFSIALEGIAGEAEALYLEETVRLLANYLRGTPGFPVPIA